MGQRCPPRAEVLGSPRTADSLLLRRPHKGKDHLKLYCQWETYSHREADTLFGWDLLEDPLCPLYIPSKPRINPTKEPQRFKVAKPL